MIEPGDQIPNLSISLTDSTTGQPADGGAVTLTITQPDQSVVTGSTTGAGTLTISHPATGEYTSTYVVVQTGTYTIEWTVSGANAGTFRDTIYVEPNFSIVSLAEVKAHLGVNRTSHDEMLRLISLMASDACESAEGTNRRWRRRIVTNELHAACDAFQLYNAPVMAITSLVSDDVLLSSTDYDVNLDTGWVYGVNRCSTRRFSVQVSYIAGATAVPPIVRNGVLEMCRHLYSAQQGGSKLPSQPAEDYTTSLGYLIPNRVRWAWIAYRRP